MKYISTNHKINETDFREAVIKGLAGDGGLYYPTQMPVLSEDFLKNISEKSFFIIRRAKQPFWPLADLQHLASPAK